MRTKSILSLVAALMSFGVLAVPVSVEQAEKAVGNWLRRGRSLEKAMGRKVAASRRCVTTNGVPFHVVKLEGGGFVITSGDTMIEPVVAFSADADLVEDERNPLWVLIRRDLANRAAKASSVAPLKMASGAANGGAATTPEERWEELISPSALRYGAAPQENLADVRVAPLVKSKWGQTKNSRYSNRGDICYNYYTPNNYCCGCVATAMAQIMRCHRYPTSATVASRNCKVDGVTTLLTMKGGTYDWANMKLVPEASTSLDWYDGGATATEREAIGKLTYDCGVAMCMSYASGGSGSHGSFAHDPIKNVFKYKNAVSYLSQSSISVDLQKQIMNPNFDAGYPVMVSVYGHEIIADGYGYSGSVLFTHLNMGWDGIDDVWYNLPDIECPKTGEIYDYIDGIVYNIFPDKTGDIFSGRVTDASGSPIEGATVTVRKSTSTTTLGTTVTGANGIYAFILTGGSTYVATATYGGASASCTAKTLTKSAGPSSVNLQTGRYSSTGMKAGNSWGNDIKMSVAAANAPTISPASGLFHSSVEVTISCATAGATIRYTTDGSTPTEQSAACTGVLLIENDTTLKARAYKSGMNPSEVVTATYTRAAEPGVWTEDAERVRLSAAADGKMVCVMMVDSSVSGWGDVRNVIYAETFLKWAAENGIYLVVWDYVDGQGLPQSDWFFRLRNDYGKTSYSDWDMYFAKPSALDTAIGYGRASSGKNIGTVAYDGSVPRLVEGFASVMSANGLTATAYGPSLAEIMGTEGVTWANTSGNPWRDVGNGTMRAGGLVKTGYTSTMTATVKGKGKLTFSYKVLSYSGNNIFTFSENGSEKLKLKSVTDDSGVGTKTYEVTSASGATFTWTYKVGSSDSKYDYASSGVWISDVRWEPSEVAGETAVTDEVPIPVKYDWLAAHFPSAAVSGYQNLVATHGANGLLVWESYLLGLDPGNPTNDFRILSFTMRDGMPVVQGNVDSDRVKDFGFEMKVKGKRDLVSDNEVWSTDLGGKNYFKVFVEPK